MPPAPEAVLPVQHGEILAEKYSVERVLGVGGMGVVVSARHKDLGHLVAIKLLLVKHAHRADVVERFLREARATAQLRSEHAVRISDVGLHKPRASAAGMPPAVPYMVMEHLDGKSLWGMLQRGPLPVADAAEYIAQACEALEEAHRLGIIHRDLKPDNLFVTRRPSGAPLVKVLDFGISRVPGGEGDTRLTGLAEVMGTPHYMAPEQMMSARNADARSDVWALGATLYELCTGRMAFPGENVAEICTRVLTTVPASPRALRPEIPIDLDALILRCLEKSPSLRPASAAELGQALGSYRAGAHSPGMAAGRASAPPVEETTSLYQPRPTPPVGDRPSRSGAARGATPAAARTGMSAGQGFALAETEHAAIAGDGSAPKRAGLRWALLGFGATSVILAVIAVVLVLTRGHEAGAAEGATSEPAVAASSAGASSPAAVTVAPAPPSAPALTSSLPTSSLPTSSLPSSATEPGAPPAVGGGAIPRPVASPPASPLATSGQPPSAGAVTKPQGGAATAKPPSSPFKDHR